MIDFAEDRENFSDLLLKLKIPLCIKKNPKTRLIRSPRLPGFFA